MEVKKIRKYYALKEMSKAKYVDVLMIESLGRKASNQS